MSKKSLLERELKRIKLNKKFYKKRIYLKKQSSNLKLVTKIRWKAYNKLQLIPKNSSSIRLRNRCFLTGRSRGYFRKFGLSRIKIRELAFKGEIPGLKKSSW